jgi:hypothetical protein
MNLRSAAWTLSSVAISRTATHPISHECDIGNTNKSEAEVFFKDASRMETTDVCS